MYLNTTPDDAPPRKPCIRDLADLVRDHLPSLLVKSMPLKQLRRRCHEITLEHQRFREEVPLVLASEENRRQLLNGQMQVITHHSPALQHHA